jgi:hypothetical protein
MNLLDAMNAYFRAEKVESLYEPYINALETVEQQQPPPQPPD